MKNNCTLGKIGENFAKDFLENEGYEILATNFRCYFGEIDIIGKRDNVIVFVEVKARTSQRFGMPADAVNRKKQKHITAAAKYFLTAYKGEWTSVDFQVVEILVRHHKRLDFSEVNYAIKC